MKKLFFISALCFSLSAFAQSRRDSLPSISDTTRLFTIQDIQEFDQLLQSKFTIRELSAYRELFQWWQGRIAARVQAYQSPNPKPKQK